MTIPITWCSTCPNPCSTYSSACPYSFGTFYTSISPYIYVSGGTYSWCGASLPGRGSGHPCIINIDARAVSNPTTNSDTPPWVFESTSQDVAFCGNPASCQGYCGSTVDDVEPPQNAYSNGSMNNCTDTMTHAATACTPGTLATGVPAVWQPPFQAAVQGWWTALITWASGNSEWATCDPSRRCSHQNRVDQTWFWHRAVQKTAR